MTVIIKINSSSRRRGRRRRRRRRRRKDNNVDVMTETVVVVTAAVMLAVVVRTVEAVKVDFSCTKIFGEVLYNFPRLPQKTYFGV